jgi:hypothetical protein
MSGLKKSLAMGTLLVLGSHSTVHQVWRVRIGIDRGDGARTETPK